MSVNSQDKARARGRIPESLIQACLDTADEFTSLPVWPEFSLRSHPGRSRTGQSYVGRKYPLDPSDQYPTRIFLSVTRDVT